MSTSSRSESVELIPCYSNFYHVEFVVVQGVAGRSEHWDSMSRVRWGSRHVIAIFDIRWDEEILIPDESLAALDSEDRLRGRD